MDVSLLASYTPTVLLATIVHQTVTGKKETRLHCTTDPQVI